MNTIASITSWVKEQVEQGIPMSPGAWLEIASKVNALMQNLDDDLVKANMAVNRRLAEEIEKGESAAKAKIIVQSTEDYQIYLTLKAQKERTEELIRLAKKRVSLQHFDV